MNRIVLLVVTAVAGVVLSLFYGQSGKHDHREQRADHSWTSGQEGGRVLDSRTSWQNLPSVIHPGSFGMGRDSQGGKSGEGHELNTRSTIYVDGTGSPVGDPQGEGNMFGLLGPLISGAGQSLALARKASGQKGVAPGPTVPAGTILRGRVMRRFDGPSGGAPIFVLIPPQTAGPIPIAHSLKIMGYPVGLSPENRLMMRFMRVIYGNGLEAQMTGYAMQGGREGVPVDVSRHPGSQFAGSVAQNTLMMGGNAIGYMGYGNAGIGSDLAMQEAGAVVGSSQSVMPVPNQQTTYTLSAGAPVSIMIIHGFPPSVSQSDPK
ncbi:hypothetical protein [Leptospirillum ferrooxidans]|uniref:Conjugation TrbI family protein n=1 Tax=Leptospirillum ferrooxidans (strain C2-3) TaxID=1162668 RepID=I0INC8_LEPFC|nr:hypothetical protein [Leptospirillum ferrooxidans]BAM06777.1 hypothetical protein LFE_1084 [Leptospirillum ferrooxidans C2-3]